MAPRQAAIGYKKRRGGRLGGKAKPLAQAEQGKSSEQPPPATPAAVTSPSPKAPSTPKARLRPLWPRFRSSCVTYPPFPPFRLQAFAGAQRVVVEPFVKVREIFSLLVCPAGLCAPS